MLRIDPNEFDNYVTIGYSSRSVSFSFDNVYMTSRIIEGIYPSYEKVIPEESSTHVVIDRDEFKQAIEFVAVMSKETEYNTVNFIFRENHVEIFSTMPDIGGAARNIEAQINGEDIHIAFNVDYVADVLRVIDHNRVHIEFTNRYSPAKFSDPENPDYVYIATPVRT